MEVIKLNLIPTGALPVVHASQYDDGRIFRADLYDGAEVYHLYGTETISCELKKPDGNIVTLAVTNTSESFIEIQTTEQACAVAGESLAEVKIEKGADKIGSLNFILSVERSPIEGGIESESEINNLWTQVDGMVADILADSYDSANVVFDNLPTAGHGIPYTVTSEGIGNAIDNALDMTAEASGAIATFESEYALPLRDLEIEINAVETGDGNPKSPSNPYTISGFTGANIRVEGSNLWNEDWENGSIDNSTGADVASTVTWRSVGYIPVTPSTTYYIVNTKNVSLRYYLYDINNNFISSSTVVNTTLTTTADTFYLRIRSTGAEGTPYQNNVSVNYPATDTAYHAYNANSTTTPISWQSEAGTVYGGSLDVTSGVLTVTWYGMKLNAITPTYNSSYGFFAYYNTQIPVERKVSSQNIKCECYAVYPNYISSVSQIANLPDKTIYYQNNSAHFFIKDTDYNDATAFVNGVGDNMVIYEVETPTTYQLTPTQISAIVGTNNVFTDTNGDTSLEYYTKRGEQTVRIAEGVAVDVINNKSIDTLTTTDKTVKGAINELDAGKADSATTLSGYGITDAYTKTEVDNALALKFDDANRVTTGTGTFAGLLNTADRVWLITAQRLSTNSTLMLIAHKQNGNFYFKEIVKDAGMEYNYNSENGSVVVTYGGSTTGVYGGAYRLA